MDDNGNFQKNISVGLVVAISTKTNRNKIIEGVDSRFKIAGLPDLIPHNKSAEFTSIPAL